MKVRPARTAPPSVPTDVRPPTPVAFALAVASTETGTTPRETALDVLAPALAPFLHDWTESHGTPLGTVVRTAEALKPRRLEAETARDWVNAVAEALDGRDARRPASVSTRPDSLVKTLSSLGVHALKAGWPFHALAGSDGEGALLRLTGPRFDATTVRRAREVASELGLEAYLVTSGRAEHPIAGPVAVPLRALDLPGSGECLLTTPEAHRVGVRLNELFSGP